MAGISRRNLDQEPDQTMEFVHGRAVGVTIGESTVWRSELGEGWSWDEDIKPTVGLDACPMHHREYVVGGSIRYLTADGTEVVATPGDHLVIEPGHRAWVVGRETCVLVDW